MEYKINKKALKIIIIFFCIYPFFSSKTLLPFSEPIIKVLIAKDEKLRVRADSSVPLYIRESILPKTKIKGLTMKKFSNKIIISLDSNKEKFYEISNNESLIIKSSDRRGIWINSKRYSGKINIVFRDNKILAINILGVEKYLILQTRFLPLAY